MTLKAVLIDFDGTLVHSIPFLKKVYFSFLKKRNREGTEEEFNKLIGPSIYEIVHVLRENHELLETPLELAEEYKRLIVDSPPQFEFFPGAEEFILFAKANKLQVGLATSAFENMIPASIKAIFDFIATSDGILGKPFPDIYELALRKAQVSHSEAIAIEDSINGIKSALAAHIEVLWIFQERSTISHVKPMKDWVSIQNYFKDHYEFH